MKRRNKKFTLGLVPIALSLLVSTSAFSQSLEDHKKDKSFYEDEVLIINEFVAEPKDDVTLIDGVKKEEVIETEVIITETEDLTKTEDLKKEISLLQTDVENLTETETNRGLSAIDLEDENLKAMNEIKESISENEKAVATLNKEVVDLENVHVTLNEQEELNKKATDLQTKIEELEKSANDIADYEGCEDDEKALKDLIKTSTELNADTIKRISELDARGVETELEEEVVVAEEEEEVVVTETEEEEEEEVDCKKEDQLSLLIAQMQQQQQQMSQQMNMMNMMMMQSMFMSNFNMRPSVQDNYASLMPMMMMQTMNNMQMTSNMGMLGMMTMAGSLGQQNPSLYVGGNMYGGDYSALTNPAMAMNPMTNSSSNMMNWMNMTPSDPYAHNFATMDRDDTDNKKTETENTEDVGV